MIKVGSCFVMIPTNKLYVFSESLLVYIFCIYPHNAKSNPSQKCLKFLEINRNVDTFESSKLTTM